MVQGIIIPADNTAPLRTATLDSLDDYQRAVGGWIEAVDIPDLGVTTTRKDSSATCRSTGALRSCGGSTSRRRGTHGSSVTSRLLH